MPTRRDFLSATLAAAVAGTSAQTWGQELKKNVHAELMKGWTGDEEIAMVLYEGFTPLDLFGPHHMFILMGGAKVHLVAETRDPIKAEGGVVITPTMSFEECPQKLTVLFVPGGSQGTLEAMKSDKVRNFVSKRGAQANWVASVCTGSLVLAAAGLLDGYKATSHWLARPALAEFGATPIDERVVIDRNRITGAGVTAGLDLGLSLVGKFRGDTYAMGSQLFAEYDPHPPYNAGSCETAPPEIVSALRVMHSSFNEEAKRIARQLRE